MTVKVSLSLMTLDVKRKKNLQQLHQVANVKLAEQKTTPLKRFRSLPVSSEPPTTPDGA